MRQRLWGHSTRCSKGRAALRGSSTWLQPALVGYGSLMTCYSKATAPVHTYRLAHHATHDATLQRCRCKPQLLGVARQSVLHTPPAGPQARPLQQVHDPRKHAALPARCHPVQPAPSPLPLSPCPPVVLGCVLAPLLQKLVHFAVLWRVTAERQSGKRKQSACGELAARDGRG